MPRHACPLGARSKLTCVKQSLVPARRRARATLVAILAVGSVSLILTACGVGTNAAVLTVNGSSYTRDTLETEMVGLEAAQLSGTTDPAQRAKLTEQFHGTDRGHKTWSADFTAFMLDRRMVDRIINQAFEASKLPKATLAKATKDQLVQGYGGQAIYDTLPKSFRDAAERSGAEFDALKAAGVKSLGDPAAYFTKHKAEYPGEVCASHILVATEAEALAIKKQLDGGGDFAAIAKAKSTDKGSGAQGGELGCTAPSAYVPEFAAATTTLPINKLSDPVKTQFGFHLIKVTKRTEASYKSSKNAIAAAMSKAAQASVTGRLVTRLKAAKVTVDPSFGSYTASGPNGFPAIVAKPKPSAVLVPPAAAPGG